MNKDYLSRKLPLFKIYTFDSVTSTNNFAKCITDDFAIVTAQSQTAGRGRLGRHFASPPGTGLYFSAVLKIPHLYQNIPFITTAASVAVQKGILDTTGIKCGIKWVNDIYLNSKKVSGILCEVIDDNRVVIGIGINLFPGNFPMEATSLFESYSPLSSEDLLISVTTHLTNIISKFPSSDFMDYYKENSVIIGKNVICTSGGASFTGKAVDIDSKGGLVVLTAQGLTTLSTGEISVREITQFQNPPDRT